MDLKITNVSGASLTLPAHPFGGITLANSASATLGVAVEDLIPNDANRTDLNNLVQLARKKSIKIEHPFTPLEWPEVHSILDMVLLGFGAKMQSLIPQQAQFDLTSADGVFGPVPVVVCPLDTPAFEVKLDLVAIFSAALIGTDGTNYITLTLKKKGVDGSDVATLKTLTTNSSGGAAIAAGLTAVTGLTGDPITLTAGQSITIEGAKGGTGSAFKGGIHVAYALSRALYPLLGGSISGS